MYDLKMTSNQVSVVVLALHANGNSSYRDAAAISRVFKKQYKIPCTILSDTNIIPDKAPGTTLMFADTKTTLISSLRTSISQVGTGRTLILFISAHGYTHRYPAKERGYVDYLKLGHEVITNTELHYLVFASIQEGVKLLGIIDTCHSGHMLDLEYASSDGVMFQTTANKTIMGGLGTARYASISACRDDEVTGEDVSLSGGWGGKLVGHFLDALPRHGCTFNLLAFYKEIHHIFTTQKWQRTHPIISYS